MNKKAFSLIELSVVILVIGILVIGVTQGSRILKEAKLKSARSLTASSPVVSMSNLVLWLDATDDSKIATGTVASSTYGVVGNGLSVVKWRDRNPQLLTSAQKELTASADGNRPTYVKNGINGLPTFDFDGSADTLINASGVIAGGKSNYTMIAVWQADVVGQYLVFGQSGNCGPSAGASAGIYMENGLIGSWACGLGWDYNPVPMKIKTPYISIIKVNKNLSANKVTIYLNGTTQSGNPTNGTPALILGTMGIGSDGTGGVPFNGYISEIIVFDRAINNQEIAAVKDYLSKKYSIKI